MNLQADCIVCGRRAIHLRPTEEPVCARPECRFVASEKGKIPHTAYAQFFAERSRHIREHDRQEEVRAGILRIAQEKEDAENRACRQERIGNMPGYGAARYPLVAVPHNGRRLINLPERRKREFRDKLNRLISSLMASPDALYTGKSEPNPPPDGARLLGGICTLCAGACCLNGGTHAYVRELTLLRVMRADPSLRPRHILDLYLSHLGRKTYEEACVYQGEKGCVLPAELRSNTCPDYFCPPLKQFRLEFHEDEKPEGAFVVVRAREHWPFPAGVENGIAGAFLLTASGAQKLG
ncbi:MAG: hypothetical protein PHU46_06930 [Rhodocyclaceae bacterium]|nr:hypothetical protein [Rhodocyclaceae bacterium]